MGAFGGGREGVQRAEMMRGSNMNRASLQAQTIKSRISTSTASKDQEI